MKDTKDLRNLPNRMTTAEFRKLGIPMRTTSGNGTRRSKYNNRKTFAHGLWFDSLREADRYPELMLLERAGRIRDLKRQIYFVLVAKNKHFQALRYKADYTYDELTADGQWEFVVEDCKGFQTQMYLDKKKQMYDVHGIIIRET